MSRLYPPPHYDVARVVLREIENDYFLTRTVRFDPSDLARAVSLRLDGWLYHSYGNDVRHFGVVKHMDVMNQLIAHHLCEHERIAREKIALGNDDFFDGANHFLRCVDGWMIVLGQMGRDSHHPAIDALLEKSTIDFFDSARDALTDAYWDAKSIEQFVRYTRGSALAGHAGALVARGLACEYRQCVDRGETFIAKILYEVDEDVFLPDATAASFSRECKEMRTHDGMEDFATYEWFSRHNIAHSAAALSAVAYNFSHGLLIGGQVASDMDMLTPALALCSTIHATHALANAVFFQLGNHASEMKSFLDLLELIEKNVDDKSAFAEVVLELARTPHFRADPTRTALKEAFLVKENETGCTIVSSDAEIDAVIDNLLSGFQSRGLELPAELLTKIYTPSGKDVDPEHHSELVMRGIGLARESLREVTINTKVAAGVESRGLAGKALTRENSS